MEFTRSMKGDFLGIWTSVFCLFFLGGLIAFSSATALLPYGAVLPKSVSINLEESQLNWGAPRCQLGRNECAGEAATKCAAKV